MHYHEHVHNTSILERSPDLYWMISPRLREVFRLRMFRTCDKERLLRGSVQLSLLSEANLLCRSVASVTFVRSCSNGLLPRLPRGLPKLTRSRDRVRSTSHVLRQD